MICKEDLKSYSVFKLIKKINAGLSLVFLLAWIFTIIIMFKGAEYAGLLFMLMLIASLYMIMEIVYFVVRINLFNKLYRDVCSTAYPEEDIPRSIKRVKRYRIMDILVLIFMMSFFALSFVSLITRVIGIYQCNLVIKELKEVNITRNLYEYS